MKVEENLKKQINKTFGKRALCLIFYGSRAFNINVHKDSDYDFVLVLDKYKQSDLKLLNQILKKNHSRIFQ